jgi:hypothetical protein
MLKFEPEAEKSQCPSLKEVRCEKFSLGRVSPLVIFRPSAYWMSPIHMIDVWSADSNGKLI